MRSIGLFFLLCLSANAFGFTTYEKVKFVEAQLGKALEKMNITLLPETIDFKKPMKVGPDSSADEIVIFVAKQGKIGFRGEVRLFEGEVQSLISGGWTYGYVTWNHIRPAALAPAICPHRDYMEQRSGHYLAIGSVKTYSDCTNVSDMNPLNLDLKVLPGLESTF